MRPSQVVQVLTAGIPQHLPFLLVGAPGVGKTDIVTLVAEVCGYRVISSHPVVSDPTDYKGLPWPDAERGIARFLPMGEMADILSATEPTIWCIDDIGQAPPAVQAAVMQYLLARRCGGHALPDCVTVVACTNRRQDRAGVTGILEPVKSRFAAILPVEPNLDDWTTWALGHDIAPEVIAYLRFQPDDLCADQPAHDIVNSPSPRTWANLSKLFALGLPPHLEIPVFAGAVGEGAAVKFRAFLDSARAMVSIDQILTDPTGAPLPPADKPGMMYAVATGLASRVSDRTFPRIVTYIERLHGAGHGEYCAVGLRDCQRREPSICRTTAYIQLLSGPLGDLILGEVRDDQ